MRQEIEFIVGDYLRSPAARAVAVDIVMALVNMEKIITSKDVSQETRDGILRAFVVIFLDLPANPFWRDNAGYLTPIIATATNAWLDAGAYAKRQQDNEKDNPEVSAEALVRSVGLRSAIIEVVLAVVYCERGAGGLRENSMALRDKLLKVLE